MTLFGVALLVAGALVLLGYVRWQEAESAAWEDFGPPGGQAGPPGWEAGPPGWEAGPPGWEADPLDRDLLDVPEWLKADRAGRQHPDRPPCQRPPRG